MLVRPSHPPWELSRQPRKLQALTARRCSAHWTRVRILSQAHHLRGLRAAGESHCTRVGRQRGPGATNRLWTVAYRTGGGDTPLCRVRLARWPQIVWLLEQVESLVCVNANLIVATGYSNGGRCHESRVTSAESRRLDHTSPLAPRPSPRPQLRGFSPIGAAP